MAIGTISGTVKVGTQEGAPASNSTIRAYDRITGAMAAETTSDVNGEFTITVPDFSRLYTLTAINNSFPGYNAGIDDNKYGTASAICDVYFNDVLLLLNGQNTLTKDSSIFNRTLLVVGTPVIDSSEKLFNYPTYRTDYNVAEYIGISSDAFIATELIKGEWCIEVWFKPVQNFGSNTFISFSRFVFNWLNTNNFTVSAAGIGGTSYSITTSSNTYVANQWYHLAFVRDNTTDPTFSRIRLYINGILVGSSSGISKNAIVDTGAGFGRLIGYNENGTAGYFSNLRVTKRIARYYANFTPPTAPFETTQCVIDPWLSIRTYRNNNLYNNTCFIENFDLGLNDYYTQFGNRLNFFTEDTIYGRAVAINIDASGTLGSRIVKHIPVKLVNTISFKFYLKNIGSDDSGAVLFYANDKTNQKFSIFPRREPALLTGGPPALIHNGVTTSLFGTSSLTAATWYSLKMYLLPGSTNSSYIDITNIATNTLVASTKLPGHFPPFEIEKIGFYVDFTGANLCQTLFTNLEIC